ncbi:MAG: glycerophosphodiester phosphodiesterase, partial [Candidatus Aminicenantes bacterium]|nr:glycerophosphodiester phosphodiesterase [Candidatus Aminicenantes bacterium]
VQNGYPIELDVRLLKDSEVAVFHDKSLERMTSGSGAIGEYDSTQIRRIHLLKTGQTIPLLSDVLEAVAGHVPLIIEIKNENHKVGALEKALRERMRSYEGKYTVVSFNPFSLKWFKENAPDVIRGQLSSDFRGENLPFYTKFLLRNLFLNFMSKPDFILYDIRCLPYWAAARIKAGGKPVIGWTARSPEEHIHALRFCDNVIFEGYTPK